MIMSKMKKPMSSQTQRSDDWVFAEFRFVVGVPSIAVFAIAIQVEQDGSKGSIT
jgi:lipopolysaccharide/colanic/teichoic acid biosynthesis glycosyltransferase